MRLFILLVTWMRLQNKDYTNEHLPIETSSHSGGECEGVGAETSQSE